MLSPTINNTPKRFWFQKLWGPKRILFRSGKKIWGLKNFKSKKYSREKSLGSKKLGVQKSLVKFGSITAEIFLIWTNIAITNVAWTNFTMTVGI